MHCLRPRGVVKRSFSVTKTSKVNNARKVTFLALASPIWIFLFFYLSHQPKNDWREDEIPYGGWFWARLDAKIKGFILLNIFCSPSLNNVALSLYMTQSKKESTLTLAVQSWRWLTWQVCKGDVHKPTIMTAAAGAKGNVTNDGSCI